MTYRLVHLAAAMFPVEFSDHKNLLLGLLLFASLGIDLTTPTQRCDIHPTDRELAKEMRGTGLSSGPTS